MNFKSLLLGLLVLFLLLIGHNTIFDPDMWWHLKMGSHILSSGFPIIDPGFSFTVAGIPCTAHEWLAEIIMWLTYSLGGFPLLNILFVLLFAGAWLLIYASCPARPVPAFFIILFASASAHFSVGIRPQIFTVFFLALTHLILDSARKNTKHTRLLFLLPLISLLWVNLHGAYLIGIFYAFFYALCHAAGWHGAAVKASKREILLWGWAVFLMAAITLINPYGIKIWGFPFYATIANHVHFISEWASPDFHNPLFALYLLFLGIVLFILMFSRSKTSFFEKTVLIGSLTASLYSIRHILIFALLSAPVLCRLFKEAENTNPRLKNIFQRLEGDEKTSRPKQFLNIAVFVVLFATAAYHLSLSAGSQEKNLRKYYPVNAVNFIKEHGLEKLRMFNEYRWGGYLIWEGLPVFVDGRADIYDGEIWHDFVDVKFLRENWQKVLDKYSVSLLLLQKENPLLSLLKTTQNAWRVIHEDETAAILIRKEIAASLPN